MKHVDVTVLLASPHSPSVPGRQHPSPHCYAHDTAGSLSDSASTMMRATQRGCTGPSEQRQGRAGPVGSEPMTPSALATLSTAHSAFLSTNAGPAAEPQLQAQVDPFREMPQPLTQPQYLANIQEGVWSKCFLKAFLLLKAYGSQCSCHVGKARGPSNLEWTPQDRSQDWPSDVEQQLSAPRRQLRTELPIGPPQEGGCQNPRVEWG